ncbi:MAG TPA: OsmC family peroxiredoxin [Vicinamibacterales bacterium]|nr:OsmC family peroxiredoxin [Vicinamibacterales bacterium]
MAVQSASAEWNGSLKEGSGTMRAASGAFEGPFTFVSRFETGPGTNPEELIGAAHAGCFSMALAAALGKAGHNPTSIATTAKVHLGTAGAGPTITQIDLMVEGAVPGIDAAAFQEFAEGAKKGCVVSRALAAVPNITLTANLK